MQCSKKTLLDDLVAALFRIQRYTKMGVFVCVRTLFVTLLSTTAESPPRPCDAMTMTSFTVSRLKFSAANFSQFLL